MADVAPATSLQNVGQKALRPARKSRNSIFSDSWSLSSPLTSSPLGASRGASPSSISHTSIYTDEQQRRSSLPSVRIEPPAASTSSRRESISNTEYQTDSPRIEAWDAIDLSVPSSPNLALKTIPLRPYLLGVGRHASVFLAACRSRESSDGVWQPCAAKRMNADREAQVGGFREAYILSKLNDGGRGPKHILRLLAVRDERDAKDQHARRRGDHVRSNSEHKDELGAPQISPASTIVIDMARSGSHSTPSSPVMPTHSPPAQFAQLSPYSVRRASSVRESQYEKRLVDASETPTTQTLEDPPRLVLVLELCTEGNLATVLQKRPDIVGRRHWFKWSKALAAAVAHTHATGFLHADIKPGNVMLTSDLDVRLADWGMSLPIKPDCLPTEGLGLGTTPYCAPELVQTPPHPFSFPADIFALGVTLNVLITGREPYRDARSPVEQMLWVSRGSYWQFEERHRLDLIGASLPHSGSAPSLVHSLGTSDYGGGGSRPPSRVGSIRSLRSLAAENASIEPADLHKLLGAGVSTNAISLARDALANAAASASYDADSSQDGPVGAVHTAASAFTATYSDGTPLQYFLDGREPVPEGVRQLLKRMTSPHPADRPTAPEVVNSLAVF